MDLDAVLDELLAARGGRTGDLRADLVAAGQEIQARRERNHPLGSVVIDAMQAEGLTFRDIEGLTGIRKSTAQRWIGAHHGERK